MGRNDVVLGTRKPHCLLGHNDIDGWQLCAFHFLACGGGRINNYYMIIVLKMVVHRPIQRVSMTFILQKAEVGTTHC
jgi:hypothetical protein